MIINSKYNYIYDKSCDKIGNIKYIPFMLSNYYYKFIDDYFWAFSRSRKNKDKDITPFLEFYLEGVISSFKEIKTRVFSLIRKFTLREYYFNLRASKDISQRPFILMMLLLDKNESFSFKDLLQKDIFQIIYKSVNERTIRRDIEKLLMLRLIVKKHDKYELNVKVLG